MAIKPHKFRSKLITILAVMVIFFAVVFSLFRLAVPYITDYVEDIEVELTQQLGMKVEISMVHADIAWLVPRLKLLEVDLYDNKTHRFFLHFEEIILSINWLDTFRNLKPALGVVSLVGLDLNIQRDSKGDITVQGFKVESSGMDAEEFVIPEELNSLLENSSMYLVDSTLRWSDQLNNNQKLVFENVNVALINDSPGHKLSINLSLPESYGENVELIIDIEGALVDPLSWNGRLYAGIENLRLKNWFNDYWQYIDFTGEGELNANIWIEWHDQKITEINAELNAKKLALHYLDNDVRSWELDGISSKARWELFKDSWKLDVRELEIVRNKKTWPVASSIVVEMDEIKNIAAVESNFLRIEDLSHLAGLGARFLPQNDFNWNASVEPHNPHGDLYELKINIPLDYMSQTKLNTRFIDLSYLSTTAAPSVNGLDGWLSFDGKHTELKLNSQNVSFDFNDLFRNDLFFTGINGIVNIDNDLSGWLVQSNALLATTPHLNTATHFKIEMPVDEPFHMDLVGHFNNGDGSAKGLYLPTKIMSDGLISWLDNALVKMEIPSGGIVYHGYFKDFPFSNNDGVFEVLFDVKNATLQYLPDWPALNNMQAEVRFYNQGMSIRKGAGTVFDARFDNTEMDIEDFNNTHVSVDGKLHAPLSDALKFAEQSPLRNVLGSYVTSFGVTGETDIDLNLQIPISTDESTQVAGQINFKGNDVYLPEENFHFSGFNGELNFTEKGASAQKLSASLDGYPVEMSIETISKENKPVTHIVGHGYLPVKSLLSPIEFMKPYFKGETDWNVDMYFPASKNNKTEQIDIFVGSNLKGVRSTVLGPFSKPATEYAPFKLHLGILPDEIKTYVKYSDDFKLSATLKNGQWFANVDTPSLKGQSTFMSDLSLNEVATIKLDYINISEFNAEEDAPEGKMAASDYPPVKFYTKKLDWKNKTFSDVSIQTQRIKSGMKFNHFELHAPGINIMGKGVWRSSWINKNVTELEFELEALDLGLGLNSLNIAESVKGTKGQATFKWKWGAEPYKFDWKILQGNTSFTLEDGSLKDIDAGAGRLLGVLNFETIFSLDFRNQVADGFSFDDLSAHFKFSNGHAYTRDLEIESKVADIKMQGRVELVAQEYDLEVEVFPKVSNAFTAIGVATGGPILGIGIHLFQKIFGVDEAAGSRSTVTGAWDAPVITEIETPKAKNEQETDEATNDDF